MSTHPTEDREPSAMAPVSPAFIIEQIRAKRAQLDASTPAEPECSGLLGDSPMQGHQEILVGQSSLNHGTNGASFRKRMQKNVHLFFIDLVAIWACARTKEGKLACFITILGLGLLGLYSTTSIQLGNLLKKGCTLSEIGGLLLAMSAAGFMFALVVAVGESLAYTLPRRKNRNLKPIITSVAWMLIMCVCAIVVNQKACAY